MQSTTVPPSVETTKPAKPTETVTRICTRCGEEKVLGDFALCRTGTDEYRPWCKACWNGYNAELRRKKRKNKLRSVFFALGRARRPREVEMLSIALMSQFGGADRAARELLEDLRGMDKGCPSYCKFWSSIMQTAFFAKQAEAERDRQYDEAVSGLSYDERLEWDLEPMFAEMLDRGELVPILRRLVQQGKLKVEDLK